MKRIITAIIIQFFLVSALFAGGISYTLPDDNYELLNDPEAVGLVVEISKGITIDIEDDWVAWELTRTDKRSSTYFVLKVPIEQLAGYETDVLSQLEVFVEITDVEEKTHSVKAGEITTFIFYADIFEIVGEGQNDASFDVDAILPVEALEVIREPKKGMLLGIDTRDLNIEADKKYVIIELVNKKARKSKYIDVLISLKSLKEADMTIDDLADTVLTATLDNVKKKTNKVAAGTITSYKIYVTLM